MLIEMTDESGRLIGAGLSGQRDLLKSLVGSADSTYAHATRAIAAKQKADADRRRQKARAAEAQRKRKAKARAEAEARDDAAARAVMDLLTPSPGHRKPEPLRKSFGPAGPYHGSLSPRELDEELHRRHQIRVALHAAGLG